MHFPTVDDVLETHKLVLQRNGGTPGILNVGAVDSALYRAKWGPFEGNPSLAARAALLLRGLCQDHPFADGNKRTAMVVALGFMEKNGAPIEAAADDIVRVALEVAQDRLDLGAIERWLADPRHNVKQGGA